MNKSIVMFLATSLAAAPVARALAPTMAVSFAPNGEPCSIAVDPFAPFNLYAGVYLPPDVPGITGAEFRITNVDPGWFSTVTPNPAASLSLGSPIALGASIAFPACQTGHFVLLYTINSLALAEVSARDILMVQHTTPSNPSFQCPLVTLCDPPALTKLCCASVPACMNQTTPCWCIEAVSRQSWSRVKALYSH